jgi:hypothetical protein
MLYMKKRKCFAGITYQAIDEVDFEFLDKIMSEGIRVDGPLNIKHKRN